MAAKGERKSVGHEMRVQVWDKTLGNCWYCGNEMTWGATRYKERPHIDHVIPVADGGTNDISNLVYSCADCNQQKHDFSVERFRKVIVQEVCDRIEDVITEYLSLHHFRSTALGEELWLQAERAKAVIASGRLLFYGEMMDTTVDDYVI